MTMTADQFEALAKLLRMKPGDVQNAVRAVLVDGVQQSDAARANGVTRQQVGNSVRRCRDGMALARAAAGIG